MNGLTKHMLKQVEWLNILKSQYGCIDVELEHRLGKTESSKNCRADVFGETQNGKIFLVEIGSIDLKKMKSIQYFVEKAFSERNKITSVLLVDSKSCSGRMKLAGREKIEFDKFIQHPFVKVM